MTGDLEFNNAVAYAFRGTKYSQDFIAESYDNVVEVTDSVWLQSLQAASRNDRLLNGQPLRHYAVMLSEHGYYEVAATDFRFTASRQADGE